MNFLDKSPTPFFEGRGHSVRYEIDGLDATVGHINQGTYELTPMRYELVVVIAGDMTVQALRQKEAGMRQQHVSPRFAIDLPRGLPLEITVPDEQGFDYLCLYHDTRDRYYEDGTAVGEYSKAMDVAFKLGALTVADNALWMMPDPYSPYDPPTHRMQKID